jgi:hypothetical protein
VRTLGPFVFVQLAAAGDAAAAEDSLKLDELHAMLAATK